MDKRRFPYLLLCLWLATTAVLWAEVPSLVGLSQEEAGARLQRQGMSAIVISIKQPGPAGRVLAQDPAAGKADEPRVRLFVSAAEKEAPPSKGRASSLAFWTLAASLQLGLAWGLYRMLRRPGGHRPGLRSLKRGDQPRSSK